MIIAAADNHAPNYGTAPKPIPPRAPPLPLLAINDFDGVECTDELMAA